MTSFSCPFIELVPRLSHDVVPLDLARSSGAKNIGVIVEAAQ
ncbi:MAG TPA: hypothetical protein VG323_09780 [Thermoanaerobaculia bacterium]|nr:hypothetical protein [Thermoanaerobaculia bacterium]